MRNAANRIWRTPLSQGTALSAGGTAVFVLAVALVSHRGVSLAQTAFACAAFRAAGWLVAAGWLQRRREAVQWPFSVPVFEQAVSTVLRRTGRMLGLALGLICLAALSLFVFATLSCVIR